LPSAQDQVSVLHQQRGEACQQQLPAVGVAVDRLVERDLEPAGEIVVLVARAGGGKSLEQRLEVPQQKRLVLVDRDAHRRVQGLQVDAAHPKA